MDGMVTGWGLPKAILAYGTGQGTFAGTLYLPSKEADIALANSGQWNNFDAG